MTGKGGKRILGILILLLILAALLAGGPYLHRLQAEKRADRILEQMQVIVPGLGKDTGISDGAGQDPLPRMVIDDLEITGCLEIPALDLMVPVTAGEEEPGLAALFRGSPVKEPFCLSGSPKDVFRKLPKAMPGDRVIFTDLDGVRYTYEVTTQFHIKEWDEADNDLLLVYETDPKTYFAVGCKRLP